MAIKLVVPVNTVNNRDLPKAIGLVTTQGMVLDQSVTTGLLEVSGAATTQVQNLYMCLETIAAGARTDVNATYISNDDIFTFDLVNAGNIAHNGQRMLIAAGGLTLNNTGTDNTAGVFQQIGLSGTQQAIVRRV